MPNMTASFNRAGDRLPSAVANSDCLPKPLLGKGSFAPAWQAIGGRCTMQLREATHD